MEVTGEQLSIEEQGREIGFCLKPCGEVLIQPSLDIKLCSIRSRAKTIHGGGGRSGRWGPHLSADSSCGRPY